jgi:hypothetical protein
MAGLLARAGVRPEVLGAVATAMNCACREVHERFAATVSSGALGIPGARQLLAGDERYLAYLEDGVALGGPSDRWPWQFRESAIQMLLRTLMQPAELIAIAERGFAQLSLEDVADERMYPDVRLQAIGGSAGSWWEDSFAAVLASDPQRGGDTGGYWSRELPQDTEAMEVLKAWEDTVLIPALSDAARGHLAAAGMRALGQDEYLSVVDALRASFLELAPDGWQIEVFVERRRLHEEMLGAEREALILDRRRGQLELCEAAELSARAAEFLLEGPGGPQILAIIRRQSAGLDELPVDGPPLVAMGGQPATRDGGDRRLPLALMRPGLSPTQLAAMFASLPVITRSSLRTSLQESARHALLELPEALTTGPSSS